MANSVCLLHEKFPNNFITHHLLPSFTIISSFIKLNPEISLSTVYDLCLTDHWFSSHRLRDNCELTEDFSNDLDYYLEYARPLLNRCKDVNELYLYLECGIEPVCNTGPERGTEPQIIYFCEDNRFEADWNLLTEKLFLYDEFDQYNNNVFRIKYKISDSDDFQEKNLYICSVLCYTTSKLVRTIQPITLENLKNRLLTTISELDLSELSFVINPQINPYPRDDLPWLWIYIDPLPFYPQLSKKSFLNVSESII